MIQMLFFVHGMGCGARTDGSLWYADVRAAFDASVAKHKIGNASLSKRVRWDEPPAGWDGVWIRPITYHDSFDEFRQKTEAIVADRDVRAMLKRLDLESKVDASTMDSFAKAGDFFWTHVLDVLLYRFIPDAGTTPIRTTVANAMLEALSRARDLNGGTEPPTHIVAHSLGTAVTHDALSGRVTEAFQGTRRIASLHTLANVCKVLEVDHPAYTSTCRPISTAGKAPGGMVVNYFEVRHELDPIPLVDGFSPTTWGSKRYLETVTTKVMHWNVHGFTHYLQDPRTHIPILGALFPQVDWASRRVDAIATFDASAPVGCAAALGKLRVDLSGLGGRISDAGNAPIELARVLSEARAMIEEARLACGKAAKGSET